jgi:hypothetical protein
MRIVQNIFDVTAIHVPAPVPAGSTPIQSIIIIQTADGSELRIVCFLKQREEDDPEEKRAAA